MGDERGFDTFAALEDRLGMEPEEGIEAPPGVIEVAVGDDDVIDAEEVDPPHLLGVGDEDARVARIEEKPGSAVLNVNGEPRFCEEVAIGEGGVIHEDREFHLERLRHVATEVAPRGGAASAANESMQVLGTSRLRSILRPPEKRSRSPPRNAMEEEYHDGIGL